VIRGQIHSFERDLLDLYSLSLDDLGIPLSADSAINY
jgi:hypothetical protein